MITGHSVTVMRYETDRYGDRTKVAEFAVPNCAFAPRSTSSTRGTVELTDRSGAVTADAELYIPYGADIRSEDVIRLPDNTDWEVVGAAERWLGAYVAPWQAGTVIPLRRKTG